ncbi:MAG: hypothetical protein RSC68_24010 [Acinetobacter sp.]
MKNLLSVFQSNEVSSSHSSGLLTNPGDKMEARVTDTNRKVIKVQQNNGTEKYSVTQYQNGTIVETKTTKGR